MMNDYGAVVKCDDELDEVIGILNRPREGVGGLPPRVSGGYASVGGGRTL